MVSHADDFQRTRNITVALVAEVVEAIFLLLFVSYPLLIGLVFLHLTSLALSWRSWWSIWGILSENLIDAVALFSFWFRAFTNASLSHSYAETNSKEEEKVIINISILFYIHWSNDFFFPAVILPPSALDRLSKFPARSSIVYWS